MKVVKQHICGAALVLALMGAVSSIPAGARSDAEDPQKSLAAGKELFTREWVRGDKRSFAGDGLGPVFNARSCAACHQQGGVGGAGPLHVNATLVSVFVQVNSGPIATTGLAPPEKRDPAKPVKQPSRTALAKLHPALRTENSFPLHRFSRDKEAEAWRAELLSRSITAAFEGLDGERQGLGDLELQILVSALFKAGSGPGSFETREIDGANIALILSQRNTPALFGAGLIDRIPERVLEEVAAEQRKTADATPKPKSTAKQEPSPLRMALAGPPLPLGGRVARLKDGRIGRFGWKGQVASLREFTLQACSNELGLEVPGFHRAAPPWNKDYKAPGLDLSAEQCNQLIRFVASLPQPTRRKPETPQHAAEIAAGEELFTSVGCVACHRPKLGNVDGIYSDLLLHDLGQTLSDSGFYGVIDTPAAAADAAAESLPVQGESAPSTTRPTPPKFGAGPREWRTPPLWGLRDSGPYLHDGRADTVADPVALHGGEGLLAARAFFKLSPTERQQVELFLQSLTAPALSP
jgi:CxxC motif-containing protein (DUF1111 family)